MAKKDIDHYKILGVAKKATSDQIQKAYYARARELHPDSGTATPDQAKEFAMLSDSYKILKDKSSRKMFDKRLKEAKKKGNSNNSATKGHAMDNIFSSYEDNANGDHY